MRIFTSNVSTVHNTHFYLIDLQHSNRQVMRSIHLCLSANGATATGNKYSTTWAFQAISDHMQGCRLRGRYARPSIPASLCISAASRMHFNLGNHNKSLENKQKTLWAFQQDVLYKIGKVNSSNRERMAISNVVLSRAATSNLEKTQCRKAPVNMTSYLI